MPLFIAEIFVCWHVTILIHESGHFIAAWLLKLPLIEMEIGQGRLLATRSIGGIRFNFRMFPVAGHVGLAWPPKTKWKAVVFASAGVAFNAAQFFAMARFDATHNFALIPWLAAVMSAMPWTRGSDGEYVLWILRHRQTKRPRL